MYPFTEVGAFGVTYLHCSLAVITECEAGCKATMFIPINI